MYGKENIMTKQTESEPTRLWRTASMAYCFCVSCNWRVDMDWKHCAHCGTKMIDEDDDNV